MQAGHLVEVWREYRETKGTVGRETGEQVGREAEEQLVERWRGIDTLVCMTALRTGLA